MKKVSVIIPNYNGGKYIEDCMNSVINQDYKNIEVIIVDDGSTDNSVDIINEYKINNSNVKIILKIQSNMNGSVARNNGLSIATGDYVLFLDSDDLLEKNVLKNEVDLLEKNNADLLIGNYEVIDSKDNIIEHRDYFFNQEIYSNHDDIFSNLSNTSPVPSNKLYKMDIIKKFNIFWGNVRIGQDLNFYLKYLSACNTVVVDNTYLYKYRIVGNSVSRVYNFRIFDITTCFDDVKKYYYSTNNRELYDEYIPVVQLCHYNIQLSKVQYFDNIYNKFFVLNYFKYMTKTIDISNIKNNKMFKNNYNKVFFKTHLKLLYILILKLRGRYIKNE